MTIIMLAASIVCAIATATAVFATAVFVLYLRDRNCGGRNCGVRFLFMGVCGGGEAKRVY